MIDWKTQDFLEANGYHVMPVPLRDTMSASGWLRLGRGKARSIQTLKT